MQIVYLHQKSDLSSTKELSFIKQLNRFVMLFEKISFPVTLFIEYYYNDRDYKDTYYHFFASKYSNYSKYVYRIAIFDGIIQKKQLYDNNYSLEDKFIGVTTIRPFKIGSIGKTFFDPKKLNIDSKIYIRTTPFEIGLLGRKLHINSFPFSSQDSEYMTCAETSLWSMLQYYGTRYKEYKTALPHEIVNIVDDKHFQRVSPSNGLHYMQSSDVLKKFGFSSQVYYRFVGDKEYYSPDNQFKRLFHYYVESGIPLMTGISFKQSNIQSGHAVVCVGHGKVEKDKQIAYENIGKYEIANSADFVDEYVYMDDNKYPFFKSKFDEFDYEATQTKIKYFIVPLYKHVFLEAHEAEKTFYTVMKNRIFGLENLQNHPKYIIRIFLSTARNYKSSRFLSLDKSYKILDNIPLPKFVWVCEIATQELCSQGKACAEIVLDATASKNDKLNQIILLRYPNKLAWKIFDEDIEILKKRMIKSYSNIETSYDIFDKNLKET